MPGYYDDNFGEWKDMDDPDMQEFYDKVQKESVWKICKKCGRRVKLRPDYGICNSCADAMERGMDF
jgi:rRNA maturation endonuclease Nob1